MSKSKYVGLWILAIVITLSAVVFQRMTGPTHPTTVHFALEGKEYKTRLPRSITIPEGGTGENTGFSKMNFNIDGLPTDVQVEVHTKRYLSDEPYTAVAVTREGDRFAAMLPVQPQAGKLSYYLSVATSGGQVFLQKADPVIIRFKGNVSAGVLIPHILLMFVAMLLSNLAGLLALVKSDKFLKFAWIALVCLGLGGFVLGMVVQKMAFGIYWAGWPMGSDLTDNKTLLAFIFWLVAVLVNRHKKRLVWGVVAAIIMLLVYCIPHSALGSEHDYETGKLKTGMTLHQDF